MNIEVRAGKERRSKVYARVIKPMRRAAKKESKIGGARMKLMAESLPEGVSSRSRCALQMDGTHRPLVSCLTVRTAMRPSWAG